jgi:hypothetical protein
VYEVKDDDIALMPISKTARDTFEKIDRDLASLAKRLDAMDAKIADLNGGVFADLERLAKNNAQVVEYWKRHNDRLSK